MDSEKTYYLGETEWMDDPRKGLSGGPVGFSLVTSVIDVFTNLVNPGLNVSISLCLFDFLRPFNPV